jgi:hypothetical protein
MQNRVTDHHILDIPSEVEEPALSPGERKSRFLDSAGSSAFADDHAALEMTMGN